MANFNSASLTKKGMALLAKAQINQAVIKFTRAGTGNGIYTEDILVDMTELKSQKQEFPISTISVVDNATVYLKFIVSNFHDSVALSEGYYITEVGIFAEDPDEGEILYAIATAVQDQWDYLPEYNNLLPSTITMEFYATVANAAEVFIKAKSGAYVYQEDYEEYKQEIHAELQSIKSPVFEDYTETEVPDPEMALEEIISGRPVNIIHQYTKASLMGILTVAKKALNIALGRNQARVFASVDDLDAWLSIPDNISKLNVGDNFYIIATDVPDYWWDGNKKQKLETQKVDLTSYDQRIAENAAAISELNENIITLSSNVSKKQDASTAITTGNISNQSVKYATSAGTVGSVSWANVSGKPSFLSVTTVDVNVPNSNGGGILDISGYISGTKAIIPVIVNAGSMNWTQNVGIQGHLLVLSGEGAISGHTTTVRLIKFS